VEGKLPHTVAQNRKDTFRIPYPLYEAMTATPERPLRADAERNRQRILAAARDVFAERGLDVSLDDIAAHAGVGVGTVYRRFPDKDALIDALFEEGIAGIAAAARRGLEVEDPWEGFVGFLREANALQAADRGLKELLLSRGRGRERVEQARDSIAPIAMELVRRARESGKLRDDLGPFDVPLINLMVGSIGDATRDVAPDAWERFLGIVIDGLCQRRDAPTPLPAPPLDREQFATAMTRRGTRPR
jgi:AcrR family transcriptional regulator